MAIESFQASIISTLLAPLAEGRSDSTYRAADPNANFVWQSWRQQLESLGLAALCVPLSTSQSPPAARQWSHLDRWMLAHTPCINSWKLALPELLCLLGISSAGVR
jgi:hypothetical protein